MHESGTQQAALGAGEPWLVLHAAPTAPPRPRGTTGLYHFAVLVPSRADLAQSLRRLLDTRTPLQGVADHGVSESLYLADPDGIGIEIYRDRPRHEWPFVNGQLRMTTDPLDLEGLLAEHPAPEHPSPHHLAPDTRVGHIHLQVSDLDAARRFYVDVLGFELMQRFGRGALFVAAGGYHHHLGLNTWEGVGAPPPPAGAIGLDHFEVKLGDGSGDGSTLVRDPSANAILLRL